MRKGASLKIQLVLGIIIAYCIIIGGFVFYIEKQKAYSSKMAEYSQAVDDITRHLSDIETDIIEINRLKSDYILRQSREHLNLISTHFSKAKNNIEAVVKENALFVTPPEELKKLQPLLIKVANVDAITDNSSNIEDRQLAQTLEQQEIRSTIDLCALSINALNAKKLEAERKSMTGILYRVIPVGILGLSIILFALFRANQLIKSLSRFTAKEKKAKADFIQASRIIEDNNWILQRTNEVFQYTTGLDDIPSICKKTLELISEALGENFYAGSIYLIDDEEENFTLRTSKGRVPTEMEQSFKLGEGLLGEAVTHNKPTLYNAETNKQITLSTTYIDRIDAQVVLVPLYYDDKAYGLIEIVANIEVSSKEKIFEYLKRTGRTVIAAMIFGHNHIVVERLLSKTQKQTEELEAQQEELRITNEELIYKTNLLESSEEELRVQQEELSQANKELNEKAAELEVKNQDLKLAQAKVEEKIIEVEQASRYKSEFMANMSHELRTPLNSILILAKLLQDNKTHNLSEDQVKYASVIHSAGSDLLELINELLDLAKIEAGKIEINEDDVLTEGLLLNLESLFKQIAQQKQIDFILKQENFPSSFYTDEGRLEQILKNFLSNAFKFTDSGGQVQLLLHYDEEKLLFSVCDSGKGITAEKQKIIFEPFRQEDGSTSRKYGGTGLGLSISREIAKLLHGEISLESEIDQGSTFTLTIPFKTNGTADIMKVSEKSLVDISEQSTAGRTNEITPASAPTSPHGQRILIIEDDINFADILKDFAEKYNFSVQLAHDGALGIQIAQDTIPDAIILDVMLPISDGWEVLKTLKADDRTKHIPVHMMSAATFNQKDILERGAIGFLSKPVSEEKINKTFGNILLNINQDVKKVLLIEDQEVLSDMIKNAFAEQHINILQAFTLQSSLTKLRQEDSIDCVILDVNLPDGTGLDLLEEMKKNPDWASIPVIINTAQNLTAEQKEKISKHTKSMVLKDGRSTNRLIDEVNLFLNKINDNNYQPVRNSEDFNTTQYLSESPLKGKRVLIVDDDMRNVFALSTSLELQEMNIDIANNGREALEQINDPSRKFDIVLMDIMMPEMDGYEAIQHIRSNKQHDKLPIIAVTAKAMKGDREKSIQLGANDYISKPIDINKLISLIQVWLS